jgi:hypothetical protein
MRRIRRLMRRKMAAKTKMRRGANEHKNARKKNARHAFKCGALYTSRIKMRSVF